MGLAFLARTLIRVGSLPPGLRVTFWATHARLNLQMKQGGSSIPNRKRTEAALIRGGLSGVVRRTIELDDKLHTLRLTLFTNAVPCLKA